MREIRYIYILIGIALCLQGCHRESHPNNPDAGAYAISMAPTSVSASRALINDLTDLQTTGFVVYGHSTASSDKQQVFAGDNVTFDNGEWGYADEDTELRYWDATADYCFGAYAPQMAGVTGTETDDIITSLSIPLPQWQQVDGNETDLIVATSQGAAEDYLMAGGTVNLAFNHVYAQLTVEIVRNAFLRNEYRLRSLAYKDVPASEDGSYTLDYTTTTPDNSGVDVAMETDSVVIRPYAVEGVLVENEVTEATRFKYMVVPFDAQRAEGFRITLRYTNNGTEHYAVVNSGLTALEAGSSYTLRLSFDNGADILPTVELQKWTSEDTSDDEMFNW